ncbi:MAG: sigma 54-interacting transcriptional regulator [Nitrospinae bacterium]|nr:sigma 54-interacting transcriptional regulator [Nitrospinota bacterium]
MNDGVSSVAKLSLLFELSRAFSALITLDELLPCIIAQTKGVLQAESCALLLLDEARQELYFPVTSDMSSEIETRFKDIRFPADKGIAGWVLQQMKAMRVADVSQDARFYPEVDRQTGMHTRGLLCAPLRTRHGVIGVIELRNKVLGTFTEEDLRFLDALAGSIAIAIDNARFYQQVRQSEARLQEEVATLQREMAHRQQFEEIMGTGPAMARVFSLMDSAIPSPITVLLEGETGTGKELIARAIHYHGPRKDRPFVAVNCGALPDTLLESELFGHKKGAFTGAVQDKAGLFEAAHGGTIFLDEVGETTAAMQVKLLRVLQEGEIRRLGETQPRRVDVRVISATNQDLQEKVRQKRFREDLYYRISVFPIRVPPLHERREDLPVLVAHFVRRSSDKLGKHIPGITSQALEPLMHYPWPGNVRELENEIERAVALTPDGSPITPEYLSERILRHPSLRVALPTEASSLRQARLAFEREYVGELLRQNQGNAVRTAKVLGISRQMLQQKIKAYGLRVQ